MAFPLLNTAQRTAESFSALGSEARRLARLARQALIAEAELTPKPGLVDRRGNGAHADLSLELLRRSANAIEPYFHEMAAVSRAAYPCQSIRERLAAIGRRAELAMFEATGGSNAHKGAIWALGLLVSAQAMHERGAATACATAATAAEIAAFDDLALPRPVTHGDTVAKRYGVAGARGEALSGFPHIMNVGLPMLRRQRRASVTEEIARLDALSGHHVPTGRYLPVIQGRSRGTRGSKRGRARGSGVWRRGQRDGSREVTVAQQEPVGAECLPGR